MFPQAAACFENIEGDIQIPDHPLIREVMKDVLGEAMDLAGLITVLNGIRTGGIRCLAVDTTTPSQFAHEILNANPYAFLDDAPLEERRARAVHMRGTVPDSVLGEAGRLDPLAIAEVREEIRPDIRDEHEFHDLLCALIIVPVEVTDAPHARDWSLFFSRLESSGRAAIVSVKDSSKSHEYIVAAERVEYLRLIWPRLQLAQEMPAQASATLSEAEIIRRAVQGWLGILGPVTAAELASALGLDAELVFQAMLQMEMAGTALRGVFEYPLEGEQRNAAEISNEHLQWCERRLLQRIHKRTLNTLRKQIEPVAPAMYMRWVLRWQHLTPQSRLSGEQGVLEAIRSLEGFEAPALEWERALLPQRVANYDPRWLDALCLSGTVGWGRISPHPAFYFS